MADEKLELEPLDLEEISSELVGAEAPVQKTPEETAKEKVLSVPKNIQESPLYEYLQLKDSPEMSKGEAAAISGSRGASLGLSKIYTPAIGATITGRPSEEIEYEKRTKEKLIKDTSVALDKIKNKAQIEMSKENPDQNILAQYVDATEKLKQQQEEVSTMPEDSWTKRYYDLQEEMKQRESEAEQKYPATSALSEIAGGVTSLGGSMPFRPVSIPGKIISGAGMGVGIGGATGLSEGKAKILEGEAGEALSETLSGAGKGAALGAAIPGGIEAGKAVVKYGPDLLRKIPIVDEFLAGREFARQAGNRPFTEDVLTEVGRKEAESVYGKIKSLYKKYGGKIGAWEEFATHAGAEINPQQILEKLRSDILTKGVAIPEEQKNQLVKLIDKNLGTFERNKLEERAVQMATKKQEEGKLVSDPFIETKDGIPVAKFTETTENQKVTKNIIGERDDLRDDIVNKGEKFIAELKADGKDVLDSSYDIIDGRPAMRVSYIEPGTEKVTTIVGKAEQPLIGENTPIAYIKQLNKQLSEFTKLGNNELTVAANDAIKTLKENVANSVRMTAEKISDPAEMEIMLKDYQKVKNAYSNVKAAIEKAGLDSKKMGDFEDIANIDTLHRLLIGQGRVSNLTRNELTNLLKRSPEMREIADDIYKQMDKVSKWEDLFGGTEKGGKASESAKDIWLQVRRKAAAEGAAYENWQKKQAENFTQNYKEPFTNSPIGKLATASTETINNLIDKVSKNQKYRAFVDPLKRVASAPENRRSALLYALYQQPGFRQAMYDAEKETEDESDSTGLN